MKDRNIKLIQAAQCVFARYGVSKTTMNDIAKEAGVARQTLYNAYPSKDAVLRASVRHYAEQTLDAVDKAWEAQSTFAEKLETFFQHAPLGWYDMIAATPDAADLVDGIHAIAHDELSAVARIWTERFGQLIREHTKPETPAHKDAEKIADFIYSASLSAKSNAENRSTLEARLEVLKLSVVALISQ